MPKIKVLPSALSLPHEQNFFTVVDDDGNVNGPFGPFSLDELRQQFSGIGLTPSDIQNFLDQIGPSGKGLELEVPAD